MTEKDFKIICPFCNAAYTAEMELELDRGSGCPSCGSDPEATVEIKCTNCQRIVYRKNTDY